MAKYHINPKTGKPGVCDPKITGVCKYSEDGQEPEHYSSELEAEKAYERQGNNEFGATSKMTKKDKIIGSNINVYDALSGTTIDTKVMLYEIDKETGEYSMSISEYIEPETQGKYAIISVLNPDDKKWYLDDSVQASFQYFDKPSEKIVKLLKNTEIEIYDGYSGDSTQAKVVEILGEDEEGVNALIRTTYEDEVMYVEAGYNKEDKEWYFM